MSELLNNNPPDGPPLLALLTPEDLAAVLGILERKPALEDAIRRAHHSGCNVEQHAAAAEMHHALAERIHAMWKQPQPPYME